MRLVLGRRVRHVVLVVTAILLGVAAMPATVFGTTVRVGTGWVDGDETSGGYDYPDVSITGARGEHNRLYVVVREGEIEVRDDRAPVRGSSNCRRLTWHRVRCTFVDSRATTGVPTVVVTVHAGDQADTVDVTGPDLYWLHVYGGPGNDALSAATVNSALIDGQGGDDRLTGTAGEDELFGGPGNDHLVGGDGADSLYGDGPRRFAPGSDYIDGGPGRDQVSYLDHRRPVTVDLRQGSEASAGERDRLQNIEDVQGGAGTDRIAGDNGPNALEGSEGDDRVDGRGGDDELQGGGIAWWTTFVHGGRGGTPIPASPGDRVSGGLGDDTLLNGGRLAAGGPGDDVCAGLGTRDDPQRLSGCEWWMPTDDADLYGTRIATHLRVLADGIAVIATGQLELTLALARSPDTPVATGVVGGTSRRPRVSTLPFAPDGARTLAGERRPVRVLATTGDRSAILTVD